jgi:hypothetical protein
MNAVKRLARPQAEQAGARPAQQNRQLVIGEHDLALLIQNHSGLRKTVKYRLDNRVGGKRLVLNLYYSRLNPLRRCK